MVMCVWGDAECLQVPEDGVRSPGVELCRCCDSNPSPLHEWYMLLTAESPSISHYLFLMPLPVLILYE